MEKLKVIFVTGTRADYGKLKPLIKLTQNDDFFESYIFVSGMHLLKKYGETCNEIILDGYENLYIAKEIELTEKMDFNLANTIKALSMYANETKPDLMIVHGDRVDAMAGAIVGIFNNIKIAHIEGGEITGTVDEFLRHAITKMAHIHFVANEESKFRLIQLGEKKNDIYVIGSPDIDIMISEDLPRLDDVKKKHLIDYNSFAILMYHPVTTINNIKSNIDELIKASIVSEKNYIVIYPNNDHGSEIIIQSFGKIKNNRNFKLFKSLPFEDFLVLLKHSEFIIGNSSAGVREACVYGIPTIDLGTRQQNRYSKDMIQNIQHSEEKFEEIISCIKNIYKFRKKSFYFGTGNSGELFIEIIKKRNFLNQDMQKTFIDLEVTEQAIANYINEVCF